MTLSFQCNFVMWNDSVTWNDTLRDSRKMDPNYTIIMDSCDNYWKRRSPTLLSMQLTIMKTEQSKMSWCSYILYATVLGTWLSSPRPPVPGWEGGGLRSQGRKEVVPPLKEPSHSAPSANCLPGMLASPFLLVLKWYMGGQSLFDNRIVGRN